MKKNKEFTKFKSYVGIDGNGDDIFYDGHVLRKNDKTDSFLKDDTPVKCTADIEEEFAEDTVHVVLKHDISIDAEDLTDTLLAGIDNVKKVKDLTKYETGDIKTKFKEKKAKYKEKLKKKEKIKNKVFYSTKVEDIPEVAENLAQSDIQEEHKGFHRILSVKLKNKGKQEVLDMVEELEKSEFVLAASPGYTKVSFDTVTSDKSSETDNIISPTIEPVETINNIENTTESTINLIETLSDTETPSVLLNDPSFNLPNANAINLPAVWDITTGSDDVLVGIMDSGIQGEVLDLEANFNYSLSKSFVTEDDETYGSYPWVDNMGHGTQVASVVGAVGNNGRDVSGVCWNVSLVSLKISYGTLENTSQCVDFFEVFDYAKVSGIKILNYSINTNEYNNIFAAALSNYDGLFICSAGNNACDIDEDDSIGQIYPSILTNDNLISVAAYDVNNQDLWWKSNYGINSVDLVAPGITNTISDEDQIIYSVKGTSFAAPYVAGTAALIMSQYPTITNYALKKAILDNVNSTDYDLDQEVKTGGMIDVYAALESVSMQTYCVKYNKNGGSGSTIPDSIHNYGVPEPIRANTYTNSNLTFSGWYAKRSIDNKWLYYDSNGKNVGWYIEGQQPVGYMKYLIRDQEELDLPYEELIGRILYLNAVWGTRYNISYRANTGTGTMANSYGCYNVPVQLSKNKFSKNNYIFVGWVLYRENDNNYIGTDGLWHSFDTNYPRKYFADRSFLYYPLDNQPQNVYALAQWAPADTKKGDVSSDGVINSQDVAFIDGYLEGTQRLIPTQWYAADYDRNGVVNLDDSLLLQWYIDHRDTIYEESEIYFE